MKRDTCTNTSRSGVLLVLVLLVIGVISSLMFAGMRTAASQIGLHRQAIARAQAVVDQHSALLWLQSSAGIDEKIELLPQRSLANTPDVRMELMPLPNQQAQITTELKSGAGYPAVRLSLVTVMKRQESADKESN